MAKASPWIAVIEASPQELSELRVSPWLVPGSLPALYRSVLEGYYLADLPLISNQVEAIRRHTDPLALALLPIVDLRLKIRSGDLERASIQHFLSQSSLVDTLESPELRSLIRGEFHFVAAMAYTHLECYRESQQHFEQALCHYREGGSLRKSLKAELNAICSHSSIEPDQKRHIANYISVSRRCRQAGELGMAGLAMHNVSREYQRLGALRVALKMSERARALLRRDFGSVHYYQATLQHADVLRELGRFHEAQLLLEESIQSGFPEVEEARKVLQAKLEFESESRQGDEEMKSPAVDPRKLPIPWRERLQESARRSSKLGELEQRLVHLLSEGARNKIELIEKLYPGTIDFASLENRFYALVNRVRRKNPGLILVEGSRYRLCDDAPISIAR